MSRNRGDGGRFVEKASLDDVFAILTERAEPVTGKEIGEALDISNRSALDKLNELHAREAIERKKVGAGAVVWWRADDPGQSGTEHGDALERDPEDIIATLETFLDERDGLDSPLPSANTDAVREDYHARRHRENLDQLASDSS